MVFAHGKLQGFLLFRPDYQRYSVPKYLPGFFESTQATSMPTFILIFLWLSGIPREKKILPKQNMETVIWN